MYLVGSLVRNELVQLRFKKLKFAERWVFGAVLKGTDHLN